MSSINPPPARFPFIQKVFADSQKVFADSVYAGERVATATSIVVEIVRKLPDQAGVIGDDSLRDHCVACAIRATRSSNGLNLASFARLA